MEAKQFYKVTLTAQGKYLLQSPQASSMPSLQQPCVCVCARVHMYVYTYLLPVPLGGQQLQRTSPRR